MFAMNTHEKHIIAGLEYNDLRMARIAIIGLGSQAHQVLGGRGGKFNVNCLRGFEVLEFIFDFLRHTSHGVSNCLGPFDHPNINVLFARNQIERGVFRFALGVGRDAKPQHIASAGLHHAGNAGLAVNYPRPISFS